MDEFDTPRVHLQQRRERAAEFLDWQSCTPNTIKLFSSGFKTIPERSVFLRVCQHGKPRFRGEPTFCSRKKTTGNYLLDVTLSITLLNSSYTGAV
jgi:hypothetical protein